MRENCSHFVRKCVWLLIYVNSWGFFFGESAFSTFMYCGKFIKSFFVIKLLFNKVNDMLRMCNREPLTLSRRKKAIRKAGSLKAIDAWHTKLHTLIINHLAITSLFAEKPFIVCTLHLSIVGELSSDGQRFLTHFLHVFLLGLTKAQFLLGWVASLFMWKKVLWSHIHLFGL